MMLKGGAQWVITEVLKASQDRMVSTATEARDSFVAYPQSDKGGLIEIEDKPGFGSRAIFDDQSGDGLSPKAAHGLEAMAAVGSPETTAWCHNSDDGVEKTPSLTNNVGEPFVV